MPKEKKNLAVIATWLRCIDGVSMEADKWVKVYKRLGYNVFLIAGKMRTKPKLPRCIIPKLDFMHPKIRLIKRMAFEARLSKEEKEVFMQLVEANVAEIKPKLKKFIKERRIEIIHVENLFSIPYNLPAAIALKGVIDELNLKCIVRHHDFYWERDYFMRRYNIPEIIGKYFPPKNIEGVHITINQNAYAALFQTKGIKSTVIGDFFDFDSLDKLGKFNKGFREDFGIKKNQLLYLQPTRIIRRKRIERSIRLINKMNQLLGREGVLIITGPPLYPNERYFKELFKLSSELNVRVILADARISIKRGTKKGKRIYTIGDAYLNCDVVTFPSDIEGFGLPVLEACGYKKPLFVNNYPVLHEITKKGFDFILVSREFSKKAIKKMQTVLTDAKARKGMVEKNFELLKRHYSLDELEKQLKPILQELEEDTFTKILKEIFSVFRRQRKS